MSALSIIYNFDPSISEKEYMNNIRVVDDIVRETEQLMSEFYGDEETSYIFTADHGMSKIGNHGDGGIGCLRLPLIPL